MTKYAVVLSLTLCASAASADCFKAASQKYDIDVNLLKAIAKVESDYNANAISHKNAIGIMQVHEWWFPKLSQLGISKEDLFDPCVNIDVGSWILRQEIDRYGYTWWAIGAYNAGALKKNESEREKQLEIYLWYATKVYKEYKYLVSSNG